MKCDVWGVRPDLRVQVCVQVCGLTGMCASWGCDQACVYTHVCVAECSALCSLCRCEQARSGPGWDCEEEAELCHQRRRELLNSLISEAEKSQL